MADDTVAMSDSQERTEVAGGGMKAIDPTKDAAELSAALKLLGAGSQPSTPQQVCGGAAAAAVQDSLLMAVLSCQDHAAAKQRHSCLCAHALLWPQPCHCL